MNNIWIWIHRNSVPYLNQILCDWYGLYDAIMIAFMIWLFSFTMLLVGKNCVDQRIPTILFSLVYNRQIKNLCLRVFMLPLHFKHILLLHIFISIDKWVSFLVFISSSHLSHLYLSNHLFHIFISITIEQDKWVNVVGVKYFKMPHINSVALNIT